MSFPQEVRHFEDAARIAGAECRLPAPQSHEGKRALIEALLAQRQVSATSSATDAACGTIRTWVEQRLEAA